MEMKMKNTNEKLARTTATIVLTLVALGGLIAPAAAGAKEPAEKPFPPALQKKLGKALDSAWGETVAPGAIVGVWVDGRGWTATRGSTRRGAKVAPTVADHTRIGSITKTFTGTVIMQLVAEGKLKLSDTIDRWFPWVPNASQITVRQLGDMSSGINTYTQDKAVLERYFGAPQTIWKPIELIKGGVSLAPKFPVGQGFFYSNTNFLMLGQIAEKLTGKPIARLMRERIFEPLGMAETSYPYTTALPEPYWNGYTNQNLVGTKIHDATHWSPTFFSAAGQIVSTLGDMKVYAKAIGDGSLIGKAAQRERLQPNPASVAAGRQYDFAIGRDHGWITHSGEVPGYNTQFGYLPKLRATVVVFTNTDMENPGDGAPGTIPAPAPTLLSALAKVIAPKNIPTP
jgi:D-alanyl-D-alanine carboxypeptidase